MPKKNLKKKTYFKKNQKSKIISTKQNKNYFEKKN